MKLVFRKNDQEEITIQQSVNGDEHAFLYTEMIKVLRDDGELEASAIEGDFTAEESSSINNMVNDINEVAREALRPDAPADVDDVGPRF